MKKTSVFMSVPIPTPKKRALATHVSLLVAGILFLVSIIGATYYVHVLSPTSHLTIGIRSTHN